MRPPSAPCRQPPALSTPRFLDASVETRSQTDGTAAPLLIPWRALFKAPADHPRDLSAPHVDSPRPQRRGRYRSMSPPPPQPEEDDRPGHTPRSSPDSDWKSVGTERSDVSVVDRYVRDVSSQWEQQQRTAKVAGGDGGLRPNGASVWVGGGWSGGRVEGGTSFVDRWFRCVRLRCEAGGVCVDADPAHFSPPASGVESPRFPNPDLNPLTRPLCLSVRAPVPFQPSGSTPSLSQTTTRSQTTNRSRRRLRRRLRAVRQPFPELLYSA